MHLTYPGIRTPKIIPLPSYPKHKALIFEMDRTRVNESCASLDHDRPRITVELPGCKFCSSAYCIDPGLSAQVCSFVFRSPGITIELPGCKVCSSACCMDPGLRAQVCSFVFRSSEFEIVVSGNVATWHPSGQSSGEAKTGCFDVVPVQA